MLLEANTAVAIHVSRDPVKTCATIIEPRDLQIIISNICMFKFVLTYHDSQYDERDASALLLAIWTRSRAMELYVVYGGKVTTELKSRFRYSFRNSSDIGGILEWMSWIPVWLLIH